MDLEFSADEIAFRDEVRAFLATALPPETLSKMRRQVHLGKDEIVEWQRILYDKGWAAPHWPAEWGGPGWDAVRRYIFMEELLQWPAPEPLSLNINMIGPLLIHFGSEEQKRTLLPKIARLDLWFCQGFSEPNAGSDLASLRTAAVRDGDDYVINGQKIWTTNAHLSDYMFALVRTDKSGRKQEGITFLLIDMKTPGIEIRGIRSIDGVRHLNEVFFTDVRVPVTNRLGEEGMGWTYARFLLGNERMGVARVGLSKGRIRQAKAVAARQQLREGTLLDDRAFQERVALQDIELKALELLALEELDRLRKAGAEAGPRSSILKILGSEAQQASAELLMDAVGQHARAPRGPDVPEDLGGVMRWAEEKAALYSFSRAVSIYGGSNEIQKNILSKAVLGF